MIRRNASREQLIGTLGNEQFGVKDSLEIRSSELSDLDVLILISFFKVLDTWDREVQHNAKTV